MYMYVCGICEREGGREEGMEGEKARERYIL